MRDTNLWQVNFQQEIALTLRPCKDGKPNQLGQKDGHNNINISAGSITNHSSVYSTFLGKVFLPKDQYNVNLKLIHRQTLVLVYQPRKDRKLSKLWQKRRSQKDTNLDRAGSQHGRILWIDSKYLTSCVNHAVTRSLNDSRLIGDRIRDNVARRQRFYVLRQTNRHTQTEFNT